MIIPPDTKIQKDQLEELKKLNVSLSDTETHESQLDELKKLNASSLRYNKIIAAVGIVALIISVFVALK